MTIYHTFIDDAVGAGASVVSGIQTTSEYGVGISSDIVCNNLYVVGITTFASTGGYYTESVSTVGITTISIDSYQAAFININYTTGIHVVNVSHLINDTKYQFFLNNTSGGNRSIEFRWSNTDTGHVIINPIYTNTTGFSATGRITVTNGRGGLFTIYNFGGSVYGSYGG